MKRKIIIPKQLQKLVCDLRESSRGSTIANGSILLILNRLRSIEPRGFGAVKSQLLKLFGYTVFLLAFGSAFAHESLVNPEVKQQLGYFSIGAGPFPIPLPVFGVGYRAQKNHHGFDVSLQTSTIVYATELKTNLLYHYYFKPSLVSEFYFGGGAGTSILFGHHCHAVLLSPEFVFGKQYRNESQDLRFFQVGVSFPTFRLTHDRYNDCGNSRVFKFPLVILSYGIAF